MESAGGRARYETQAGITSENINANIHLNNFKYI
jgi:hypothetical protein